jgi:hypothetical protein
MSAPRDTIVSFLKCLHLVLRTLTTLTKEKRCLQIACLALVVTTVTILAFQAICLTFVLKVSSVRMVLHRNLSLALLEHTTLIKVKTLKLIVWHVLQVATAQQVLYILWFVRMAHTALQTVQ